MTIQSPEVAAEPVAAFPYRDELGELAVRAQQGDTTAITDLYPEIIRLTAIVAHNTVTHDPAAADEVAHAAAARVYEAGIIDAKFKPGSFNAWLRQVTVNVAFDALRRHKKVSIYSAEPEKIEQALDTHRTAISAEDEVLTKTTLERFDAVCEQANVSQDFREAFLLHHVYGLSYEEIAALTHIKVGTARTRIHRTKTLLAKAPMTRSVLTGYDE